MLFTQLQNPIVFGSIIQALPVATTDTALYSKLQNWRVLLNICERYININNRLNITYF